MKVWLPDHAAAGVIIAAHGFNDYSNSFKNAAGPDCICCVNQVIEITNNQIQSLPFPDKD